ncbi:MAG: hypothetical protein IJ934_01250 [Acetobacter sp.]|nr:hypothetical protein [Acetobacter sp.]
MANINFTVQGKGGVGKSVCATLLAQYLQKRSGQLPFCVDLDPVNTSFKSFKALNVQDFNILDENKQNIEPKAFDKVVETLLEQATTGNDSIIDVGTMTFLPLSGYLKENDTFTLFASETDEGYSLNNILLHVPIVAGQMFNDTKQGLQTILEFPGRFQVIIWCNPMNGKLDDYLKDDVFKNEKIEAYIVLPVLTEATFGRDFKDLLESKRTFDEALSDEKLSIVVRHRIKQIQKRVYDTIARIPFL